MAWQNISPQATGIFFISSRSDVRFGVVFRPIHNPVSNGKFLVARLLIDSFNKILAFLHSLALCLRREFFTLVISFGIGVTPLLISWKNPPSPEFLLLINQWICHVIINRLAPKQRYRYALFFHEISSSYLKSNYRVDISPPHFHGIFLSELTLTIWILTTVIHFDKTFWNNKHGKETTRWLRRDYFWKINRIEKECRRAPWRYCRCLFQIIWSWFSKLCGKYAWRDLYRNFLW